MIREPICDVIADILRRCVCPQLETLTITCQSDETSRGYRSDRLSDADLSRIFQGLAESSGQYSNLKDLMLTEDLRFTKLGPLSSSSFSRALSSGKLDHLTKLHVAISSYAQEAPVPAILNGLRRCRDLRDLHLACGRQDVSHNIRQALRESWWPKLNRLMYFEHATNMGDLVNVLTIKGTAPLRYLRLYLLGRPWSQWETIITTATIPPLEGFHHLATAFRHGACPALTALEFHYGMELAEGIQANKAGMTESLQQRAKVTFRYSL